MKSRLITVAAIQMPSSDWNQETNIERATSLIRQAAAKGANLVVCPELFMSPYFCIDENSGHFDLAEPLEDNEKLSRFGRLAAELGIVLPVGFFERAGNAFYNSVVMFDADGSRLGVYRKTHIPDNPGYSEKYYFNPGDTGFKVWSTKFGRIGVGICWDQWFPESARAMALMGAEILCYPTIIGSNPARPDSDCSDHWQRTMQGHAAANALPLICANRIGTETGKGNLAHSPLEVTFHGRSFITDQTGDKLAEAGRVDESILLHTFDLEECQHFREEWGFFRDRRPSMYGVIGTCDGVVANQA
ncbi:MAG: N-carbamoylputrescine amidase [Pseudomonadota bacterium]